MSAMTHVVSALALAAFSAPELSAKHAVTVSKNARDVTATFAIAAIKHQAVDLVAIPAAADGCRIHDS